MPLHQLRPRHIENLRRLRHTYAPQGKAFSWGLRKEGKLLVAAALPVCKRLFLRYDLPRHLRQHALLRCLDGSTRSSQTHEKTVPAWSTGVRRVVHPATGIQGQRLCTPSMQLLQGIRLTEFK